MQGARAAILVVAAVLMSATAASAQGPTGGTAPTYPQNTLKLEQMAPVVAGTVIKVRMSGHAEWNEPTDASTIAYTLSIYAQNADVHSSCEVSKGAQLQKSINIPTLGASETLTDFVVNEDLVVNPGPPSSGIDWAVDSLPFVITPGVRNVLLCGYQRYVTDDVAWYQLPVRVNQPSCRLAQASVRRGAKLRLRCNVSGPMTVRFARGGASARTVSARVGSRGTGSVATRGLRRGAYRVTVFTGQLQLGAGQRLRVR